MNVVQTLVWRSPKNCTSASSFNEWFTPHDSNQPGWGGQGLAGSLRFLSTVACCAPRLTPLCAAAQDCPNIQWLLLEETLLLQSLLQTIERKVWRSSPGRGSGVGPTGSGRDSRQTGLAPGLHMPCPPPPYSCWRTGSAVPRGARPSSRPRPRPRSRLPLAAGPSARRGVARWPAVASSSREVCQVLA